ncbi:hypothetical protein [Streptomyces olivochromogenes]|uniref:hypothetical protein n=1 Tax=Streptomyces olivochromogenes TaxID=1963 RepID=UPI00367F7D6B
MSIYINSEDAAGILGVKTAIRANKILRDRGVVNQTISASADRLNSYLADDVVRVTFDRQREALARHRNDPVTYAKEIVRELRPPGPAMVKLTDGRKVLRDTGADAARAGAVRNKADLLTMLGPDANMIFGPGVLKAAAADLKSGTCRFCVAHIETPWGGIGPDLDEACKILLGQPCLRCRVDLTPAKPVRAAARRPQTAVRASGGRPVANSVRMALKYRQDAAEARARGDAADAAVAERNAHHWLQYGREHPGS